MSSFPSHIVEETFLSALLTSCQGSDAYLWVYFKILSCPIGRYHIASCDSWGLLSPGIWHWTWGLDFPKQALYQQATTLARPFFYIFIYLVFMWVIITGVLYMEVNTFPLPCVYQGFNSGLQTWQQISLPTEPTHIHLLFVYFLLFYLKTELLSWLSWPWTCNLPTSFLPGS